MLRLITNPRPEYSEDSSDQTKIYNCQQSCFFFLQIQRILLTLYIGHRFSIKRVSRNTYFSNTIFFNKIANTNKRLNSFYRHECFISKKKNFQFFILKTFLFYINYSSRKSTLLCLDFKL